MPSWQQFAKLASAPVTTTVQGRVRARDDDGAETLEYVSYSPPDFWRIEDDARRLRYLANSTGHYQYPGDGAVACFEPRRPGFWSSGGMASPALVLPRQLVQPVDDDFTRPAGPVVPAHYLGREVWRVVLAPPADKPEPVVQTLDVATGVVLSLASTAGTELLCFIDIITGAPLPPATFAVDDPGAGPD